MYKDNATAIIAALEDVKRKAINFPDVLMMGLCSEVSCALLYNSDNYVVRNTSWITTRTEAFVCWPNYSGDAVYPVVDKGDCAEYDLHKDRGYHGGLPYWQYNTRSLWRGRQLELRLDLIYHCIRFYTALRGS